VVGKDLEKNVLYVDQGFDNELLFSDSITATNISWVSDKLPEGEVVCTAKFRYRQEDHAVTVKMMDETTAQVIFDKPIRAITPGQAVVFYKDDECLGGGTIDEVFKKNDKIWYVG
jgi:tRNA-specific 2-thiouridylase